MEYTKKIVKTSSNRELLIVDNYFTLSQIRYFKRFIENSFFKIGGISSTLFEHNNKYETFFRTDFNNTDLENFGIINVIQNDFLDLMANRHIPAAWVSALFTGNRMRYHPDSDKAYANKKYEELKDCDYLTFLYFCNLHWELDDGGETIFCDDNGEPEIAVAYKPNRFVIFDSFIPHRPTNTRASINDPRFSFVAGLVKNGIDNT